MFPGLDLYYLCTDPAHHLIKADTGSAVGNLDYLDLDLSPEVGKRLAKCSRGLVVSGARRVVRGSFFSAVAWDHAGLNCLDAGIVQPSPLRGAGTLSPLLLENVTYSSSK